LNVESAISKTDIAQEGNVLRLRHPTDLYFTLRWRRLRLGEPTYTHTIDATIHAVRAGARSASDRRCAHHWL
jgi:hypothetical protein